MYDSFPEVMENLTIRSLICMIPPEVMENLTIRSLSYDSFPEVMENLTISMIPPEVMENLTIRSLIYDSFPEVMENSPSAPAVDPQKRRGAPRYLTQAYWQNNSRKLLFLVLYALLNLTLFLGAVLMLRRFLTWLRATWVVRVLPLDQNILLHQIVGYAILVFTTAHTTAHIFNFGVLLVSPVLCVVWSVLMVHCSNFWKWFVVPGLMFLLEKIVGMAVSRMGGLYIVEVNMLPSKVPAKLARITESATSRRTLWDPTRQIFASEHAVLIGAGIGITPFASILQSIMYRRFLEMHMYMTSALSKNDMKAIGLQMALDLLAKKEKRDSITGLRTRTQPGRPSGPRMHHSHPQEGSVR
ncbi:hypothetical protein F7725_013631 [Dissostichus mawsoni]|uniref:Uncharacterized protein n=1 Tax=Dissostichus mawsoni TaxID=36200 RepID=A0A7J5YUR2_DISMA|nr:hypothetical protein F7725_013631 [Dissostichus mawsoni]